MLIIKIEHLYSLTILNIYIFVFLLFDCLVLRCVYRCWLVCQKFNVFADHPRRHCHRHLWRSGLSFLIATRCSCTPMNSNRDRSTESAPEYICCKNRCNTLSGHCKWIRHNKRFLKQGDKRLQQATIVFTILWSRCCTGAKRTDPVRSRGFRLPKVSSRSLKRPPSHQWCFERTHDSPAMW